MKRTAIILGTTLMTAGIAVAQLLPPFIISGHYTADLGCVERPVAEVDGWLASKYPFLERGPTTAPAGAHLVCPLALHYDDIFGAPPNVDELAHYVPHLRTKAGFSCGSAVPLPPGPVAVIVLMHQNNAAFVASGRAGYGYPAYLGQFSRIHTPASTNFTASANTPANAMLSFAGIFHSRVALNATGISNLAAFSATALQVPVFGVDDVTGKPIWNMVNWNATPATVKAQNANISWSSSKLLTPYADANAPSLNTSPHGQMHFENVLFGATLGQNCI